MELEFVSSDCLLHAVKECRTNLLSRFLPIKFCVRVPKISYRCALSNQKKKIRNGSCPWKICVVAPTRTSGHEIVCYGIYILDTWRLGSSVRRESLVWCIELVCSGLCKLAVGPFDRHPAFSGALFNLVRHMLLSIDRPRPDELHELFELASCEHFQVVTLSHALCRACSGTRHTLLQRLSFHTSQWHLVCLLQHLK